MPDKMPDDTAVTSIKAALLERFGEDFAVDPTLSGLSALAKIANYRSHRRFEPRPIEPELLRLLCACALSAP
jgi:nitroreductase/FMN reductase [NAD(P)H]